MTSNNRISEPIKVHFVCLGNICRSPLAEGVFRHLLKEKGLEDYFEITSSGTGSWHVGEMADRRMRQTAREYGVSLDRHRASQFAAADAEYFDHIFVMDRTNQRDVLHLDARDIFGDKVRLFRELDPEPGDMEVPDPYYGGAQGFNRVYNIVDRTARALLNKLIEQHGLDEVVQEQDSSAG